jgi:hypothetical protein
MVNSCESRIWCSFDFLDGGYEVGWVWLFVLIKKIKKCRKGDKQYNEQF